MISDDLLAGGTFAGYRIEEEAGHGGMGVVYRARHLLLDRQVALKLIAPSLARNDGFRRRFEREWRMVAALEHPNVIPVYDAGEVDHRPYLCMRWVAGGDLALRLRGTAGLEPTIALDILAQIATALDFAHAKGVVHRDIKPANVLLEDGHAWLTDFGAGKDLAAATTAQTVTGQWLGTVDYVAPEMLDGQPPGPRSDVYSLGCVLFEAVTGRVPFPRETEVATLWAHRFEPPPSTGELRASLPAALDDVLRRALDKEPANRPATAGELIRAARAAVAERPAGRLTRAPGEPSRPPAPPPTRRASLVAAAAAGAAVVGAVALALTQFTGGGDEQTRGRAAARRAPAKPPLVERIPLGKDVTPTDVAADPGNAYVLDHPHKRIIVVASSSRQRVGVIKLPGTPQSLAFDQSYDHLYVPLLGKRIADVDVNRGGRYRIIHTRTQARWIAVTPRQLVTLTAAPKKGVAKLERINIAQHRTHGLPRDFGGTPSDLFADIDDVYAMNSFPAVLVHLNARLEFKSEMTMPLNGGIPAEVAVSGGEAWATVADAGTLVRFETSTDRESKPRAKGEPQKTGREPDGIVIDIDTVWVVNRGGTVNRYSERTGKPIGTPIDAKGPLEGSVAVGGKAIWATGTDDLVRIEPQEERTS